MYVVWDEIKRLEKEKNWSNMTVLHTIQSIRTFSFLDQSDFRNPFDVRSSALKCSRNNCTSKFR